MFSIAADTPFVANSSLKSILSSRYLIVSDCLLCVYSEAISVSGLTWFSFNRCFIVKLGKNSCYLNIFIIGVIFKNCVSFFGYIRGRSVAWTITLPWGTTSTFCCKEGSRMVVTRDNLSFFGGVREFKSRRPHPF